MPCRNPLGYETLQILLKVLLTCCLEGLGLSAWVLQGLVLIPTLVQTLSQQLGQGPNQNQFDC